MTTNILVRRITFCGQPATVACDAKCSHAFGRSKRPREILDASDPDDYRYLSDESTGHAPVDLGTTEGGIGKPQHPEDRLNRWCVRECERCAMSRPGESDAPLALHDFSQHVYNIPREEP